MPKQLFPAEIAELSAEKLIEIHSRKSLIIYGILLISFAVFIASLFFISVDVNVQSRGIITTNERVTSLTIPVYGKIESLYISENTYIAKGDTLLVIDTTEIYQNLQLSNEKIKQTASFIHDLEILSNADLPNGEWLNIITPKYAQELQKHLSDFYFQQSEINILKKEYDRQTILHSKAVIPTAEYEQATYQYENALLKLEQLKSSQLSAWQTDLENNKMQLINFNQNHVELKRELQKYFLIAPFSGHIQGLSGLDPGSIVFLGQQIASIIPDTEIIGETYISTADIGMVYQGQEARLRIDAYEANTWGFINATVKEIANDITIDNGRPRGFRLTCTLYADSLQYQHKTVKIKKGMTFTSNFILMRRTLAQLLYDKVSDWINPNVIQKEVF